MFDRVIRLRQYEYIHILDNNTCDVFLVTGPRCFTLMDHHIPQHGAPQPFLVIPVGHYCEVYRPIPSPNAEASEMTLRLGGAVRMHQPPFPLRPGEAATPPTAQVLLSPNEALVLRALTALGETDGASRAVGDRWLHVGPGRYAPHTGVTVEQRVRAVWVPLGAALHLRAGGEVWAVRRSGAHFPPPGARVEGVISPIPLSLWNAIHLRARVALVDAMGTARAVGATWLVTHRDTCAYRPNPNEEIAAAVPLTVVGRHQYAVVARGKGGRRALRRGPCAFFLAPGEVLVGGAVRPAHLLGAEEALLVEAVCACVDEKGARREASARWLVRGPCSYVPPLEVHVVEARRTILLSEEEGVYVRNTRSGKVRAVFGCALMLAEDEVLWEKPTDPLVRACLRADRLSVTLPGKPSSSSFHGADAKGYATATFSSPVTSSPCKADGCFGEGSAPSYAVVSCKVPHNALVQLYDYGTNTSRVVEGPTTVFLAPNEEFTPVRLSGGRPKQPGRIHSLCIFLGPDFMADVIEVETLEHARLRLELAYNWEFDTTDRQGFERIAFSTPDFVGSACRALANRIRATIAGVSFDDFHRNSSALIRRAIFHADANGTTAMRGDSLYFPAYGLLITSVDMHSVEPVDARTREALTKSVQLAVEIITTSQENEAAHHAMLLEQKAKGALALQLIRDTAAAEEHRVQLLHVAAENTAMELCGGSKAQALAESEARLVEAQAELDATPTRCEAQEATAEAELDAARQRMELELHHRRAMHALAVAKAKALAEIDANRVEGIFKALGRETVQAIARAGPELKEKMLKALGLQGFLLTDGTAPVNLMNMADKMIVQPQKADA